MWLFLSIFHIYVRVRVSLLLLLLLLLISTIVDSIATYIVHCVCGKAFINGTFGVWHSGSSLNSGWWVYVCMCAHVHRFSAVFHIQYERFTRDGGGGSVHCLIHTNAHVHTHTHTHVKIIMVEILLCVCVCCLSLHSSRTVLFYHFFSFLPCYTRSNGKNSLPLALVVGFWLVTVRHYLGL